MSDHLHWPVKTRMPVRKVCSPQAHAQARSPATTGTHRRRDEFLLAATAQKPPQTGQAGTNTKSKASLRAAQAGDHALPIGSIHTEMRAGFLNNTRHAKKREFFVGIGSVLPQCLGLLHRRILQVGRAAVFATKSLHQDAFRARGAPVASSPPRYCPWCWPPTPAQ